MMSHWSLALLLALVGNTWSMPQVINQAMMDLAQSDIDLSSFFDALRSKDFAKASKSYESLEKVLPNLIAAQVDLNLKAVDKSLMPLVKMLDIQLDVVIFNVRELVPYDPKLRALGLAHYHPNLRSKIVKQFGSASSSKPKTQEEQ